MFSENISDILSSLSEEDIENLKATAESIFNNKTEEKNEPKDNDLLSGFDPSMIQKIMTVMSRMNYDNSRSDFIKALKPHLSTSRQKKADEAMKILKLFDILPLLQNFG